jgi:hypothetical protein
MFTAPPSACFKPARLALLYHIGSRDDGRRSAVLAAVRNAGADLERIAGVVGLRAFAFDRQIGRARDDVAGFYSGVGVARDRRAGLDLDADADGFVAGRRSVDSLQDGALESAWRVLRLGAGR